MHVNTKFSENKCEVFNVDNKNMVVLFTTSRNKLIDIKYINTTTEFTLPKWCNSKNTIVSYRFV